MTFHILLKSPTYLRVVVAHSSTTASLCFIIIVFCFLGPSPCKYCNIAGNTTKQRNIYANTLILRKEGFTWWTETASISPLESQSF